MDPCPSPDVVIVALEPVGGPYRRVSIALDNDERLVIPARVALALGLTEGQRHARASLLERIAQESGVAGMEAALAFLASRSRTEQEVRRRLSRGGYGDDAIDDVVARLYGLEYLNDADFAERFVQGRLKAHPMGRRGIAWELRRYGVDAGTVEEATARVDDQDERAAALELVRSRLSRTSEPDERKLRQRIAAVLQRRGFAWDTISSVLDEALGGGG